MKFQNAARETLRAQQSEHHCVEFTAEGGEFNWTERGVNRGFEISIKIMQKFYIFDMDGTLCDSMEFWREETTLVEDFRNMEEVEPCYDRMREHYRNDIALKDGALEFIQNAARNGIKMCIASATRRDVSQPFLEKTGIMEYMEFYIDCYEVRAFKERPDIFLKAAERLGADISECVIFEDAEYCVKTAHNAGFYVVGIYDTVADREGEPSKFCDIFADSWKELLDAEFV